MFKATVHRGHQGPMNSHKRLRAGLLVALAIGLVVSALVVPVEAWTTALMEADYWRSSEGVVLFVALYVVWNFALPPAPLQLLAGLHYGIGPGLLVIITGTSLANLISHGVARWLGRTWVVERVKESDRLYALETALARMGWKAVVLLRLSNLVPSNLANLLMGVTSLRLSTILWASLLGSLPGWALMLGLGHSGRALIRADEQLPVHWTVYMMGAMAAVALLAMLGRKAQKILEEGADREG